MHQISALCILSCALWQLAISEKLVIRKGVIADASQSSALNGYCFTHSVKEFGHWNYFHTGNVADDSGYQWLLLKLNRRIRVLSVTVYGREAEAARAQKIDVLVGNGWPRDLRITSDVCSVQFADNQTDFVLCGHTRSDNADLTHEVKCNAPYCTQYILLRKYVRNETEKYMNFDSLQIEKVATQSMQFHTCRTGGGKFICKPGGLQTLVPGKEVIVKVCMACQSISQSTCGIRSPDGRADTLNIIKVREEDSCSIIYDAKLNSVKHGRQLQCGMKDEFGQMWNGTETLGFVGSQKNVLIQFKYTQVGSQKFWLVGQNANFNFATDFGFQVPDHSCWLSDSDRQSEKNASVQQIPSVNYKEENHNNGYSTTLTTVLRLYVNSSIEDKWINCQSQINDDKIHRAERIPPLVYPCHTKLSMPELNSWKDGSTQKITVDSSANNSLPTSHSCFLETSLGNASLSEIASTNTSSKFSVNVTQKWGRNASVVCLVNQSGIFETWTRQLLPPVLFDPFVDLSEVAQNETYIKATITITDGNPLQGVNCLAQLYPGLQILWTSGVITGGSSYFALTKQEYSEYVGTSGFIKLCCQLIKSMADGKRNSPPTALNSGTYGILNCARLQLTKGDTTSTSASFNRGELPPMLILATVPLLMLGIIIAVPVTVYVWRRTGSLGQNDAPQGISMEPVRETERDPNAVYYYEEN